MAVPAPANQPAASTRAAVMRACAADQPPLELLRQVADAVRQTVPHAAAGWLLTDPATLLGTGVRSEHVSPELTRRLLEHEVTRPDINTFADLARGRRPAARLSAATRGRLERSGRHRSLYAPNGYGDELRAVFRTGEACWGQVCLTRRADEPDFSDADVSLLGRLSRHIGNGLRTSLALRGTDRPTPDRATPGVILLEGEDRVESLDDVAAHRLRDLPDDGLPLPTAVYAVARQARRIAAGAPSGPPTARVRTVHGGYVAVRGTCLASPEGAFRVAVVLEPLRPGELAPLIIALGDLTPREREVTQLLLRGTPTVDIARSLWISKHTLRGHIKAIFAKLRVHSRTELAGLLLDQQLDDPFPDGVEAS